MTAIRIREKVLSDGSLVITKLPFRPGEEVEISIKSLPGERTGKDPYGLNNPFEPAAPPEEWDAISGRGGELYLDGTPPADSDSPK